jgi:hypothetical protein
VGGEVVSLCRELPYFKTIRNWASSLAQALLVQPMARAPFCDTFTADKREIAKSPLPTATLR